MGGGSFDVYRVCEQMARLDIGLATSVLATFLGSDPLFVGATRRAEEGLADPDRAGRASCSPTAPPSPRRAATSARCARPPRPVVEDGRVAGLPDHRPQAVDQQRRHRRRVHDPRAAHRAGRRGSCSSAARTASPQNKPEDKHGIRLSNTAALFLDDVFVPVENLVGGVEGQGLIQAQQVFGYTRLMVAAFGLGGGWSALDRAITYSTERIQAGAPLSEKQGYTHKLIVPHVVRLEAARASIEETATRIDAGEGRRRCAEHRGRDREVLRDRVRQRCRRGGHPGARRLRLHPRVPRREDQARRPDHHDLRGHLGDHGDDDRAGPLAAAPEDQRRVLPRAGPRAGRRCARGSRTSAQRPRHSRRRRMAAVLEACRVGRLTRNQHVLLRLGELIAWAECAAQPGAPSGRGRRRHVCRRRRTRRFEPGRPRRDQSGVRARGCTPRSPSRARAGCAAPQHRARDLTGFDEQLRLDVIRGRAGRT